MEALKGKRALITGGTTGIGLETARAFLREGARVAITGTKPETLEAARKVLGNEVLVLASDIGDIPAQKSVAEAIRQRFGALNVLFLNAGIVDMRPLLGMGKTELAGLESQIPVGRLGTPAEVAEAVVYFASDASAFTVGSELIIDGGMSNL